jgi:hypothetical protein
MLGSIGPPELILLLLLLVPYCVPTIVAFSRRHPNAAAICVLNILLGWTIIGWVGTLIWSLSAIQPRQTITITNPPQSRNFCSNCGKAIKAGDAYCSTCGANLSQ